MVMFWKRHTVPDLDFVDTSRKVYNELPILPASEVLLRATNHQKNKYDKFKFPHCPGMYDYSKMGYIIPSHEEIHIVANPAGVKCNFVIGSRGDRQFSRPVKMDQEIVDGFIRLEGDIPFCAIKVPLPWHIFAKKGISAMLMPALYHGNYIDDLHVWPGIVDYENFSTTNFIFSPKRRCNLTINIGDPLVHVIPYHNKDFSATYGPGSEEQLDKTVNSIAENISQWYRKRRMITKTFALQTTDEKQNE